MDLAIHIGMCCGITGKIATIANSNAGNYAFRITLDTGLSGCTNNFAFVNLADENYQARVATLITLYSLGKTVQINTVAAAGGYCQIGDTYSQ